MTGRDTRSRARSARAALITVIALAAVVFAALSAAPFPAEQLTPSKPELAVEGANRTAYQPHVPVEATENESSTYVDGTVIVTFGKGVTAQDANAALAQASAVLPQRLDDADVEMGFAELSVRQGHTVEEAVLQLGSLQAIGHSQPNYLYRPVNVEPNGAGSSTQALVAQTVSALLATVNDTRLGEQWYLDEQHGVNASNAWELARGEERGTPVTIAVIDSGCTIRHEDLYDNVLKKDGRAIAYDATPSNTENDRFVGSGTNDISADGHGTHVCGIAAATANNSKGIAGVSYNAKFLPIQVFRMFTINGVRQMSATTDALLKAYSYISKHAEEYNIKVVNMSFGAAIASDDIIMELIDDTFEDGVVPVCASGNADYSTRSAITVPYAIFPGDYLGEHGLNVIALDKNRSRPSYSNYNSSGASTKDISAPGGTAANGILSTVKTSDNAYGQLYGTSMAAPIVSGVASLVFTANPTLTPGQVIDIIHSTAKDLGPAGWDEGYGYGLVDAYAAVKYAETIRGADELLVESHALLEPPNDAREAWAWTSSDIGVATVSNGVITGIAPGTATITASRDGFSVSKNVVVYSAQISGAAVVDAGADVELTLHANPSEGTWSWTSSDPNIAAVSRSAIGATVSGVNAGNATITAALSTNPDVKTTFSIRVKEAAKPNPIASDKPESTTEPIQERERETDSTTPEQTMQEEEQPQEQERPQEQEPAAKAETDRVQKREDAAAPNPEKPALPDASNPSITITGGPFAYTGRLVTPSVTVEAGGKALRNNIDYRLSYSNATNAGNQAKVTAKGIGQYLNRLDVHTYFSIAKASQTISVKTRTGNVAVESAKNRDCTVRCIKRVTGMKGKLEYKKKSGTGRLSIRKNTGLVIVKKNTKKGTYKIKVAVTAKETKNFRKSNTVTAVLRVKVR